MLIADQGAAIAGLYSEAESMWARYTAVKPGERSLPLPPTPLLSDAEG